jgi:glycosyltransferase involved in cell wall biosynthesis
MYPSPERPEYGVFVARLERALAARGHEIVPVVLESAGGGVLRSPAKYSRLAARAVRTARAVKPDVVYAHYLVPTGVAAMLTRVPFVVTAHGGDVANVGRIPGVRRTTKRVLRKAGAVICVSRYLAERLPVSPARLEIIDMGVDTAAFTPAPRAEGPGPRFLYVGSLIERKNVGRLIEAFARVGQGSLTVVGDGPLREQLEADAPAGVHFLGRLDQDAVAEQIAAADVVCQPSLVEAQGQALLEALARGRPVVGSRVGGAGEFVTMDCGVLVDPLDVEEITQGLRAASALPVPCQAAVEVAAAHDVNVQAAKVEQVLASVCLRRDGPAS